MFWYVSIHCFCSLPFCKSAFMDVVRFVPAVTVRIPQDVDAGGDESCVIACFSPPPDVQQLLWCLLFCVVKSVFVASLFCECRFVGLLSVSDVWWCLCLCGTFLLLILLAPEDVA